MKYRDIKVQSSCMIPKTIERLSESLGADEGFSLDRSYDYWLWRYEKHPLYRYDIQCFYKDEELVSIFISRKILLPDGRRAISFVEWIGDNRVDFSYMLSNAMHYFRSEEIDVFLVWGNAGRDQDFKKNIFFKRNKVPIIFHKQECVDISNISKNILFFMGSSDAV